MIKADEYYMSIALQEANKSLEKDEVPIGAIIVSNGKIIGRGYNLTNSLNDATAHAEMQAITSASNTIGSRYLNECTLYVTLEPCPMCAFATFWAQIGRIVYGAYDPKRGYSTIGSKLIHPKTIIKGGVLESECSKIITDFFVKKRNINAI